MQLETDRPELTISTPERKIPPSEGPHKTRFIEHLRVACMAA